MTHQVHDDDVAQAVELLQGLVNHDETAAASALAEAAILGLLPPSVVEAYMAVVHPDWPD